MKFPDKEMAGKRENIKQLTVETQAATETERKEKKTQR